MPLEFTTLHGAWTAGEEGTYVDSVSIAEPSPALVRLAAHAHAAGVIDVTEGLEPSDVQSQEDGEAALAAAQGDWVDSVQNEDGTVTPGYWTGPWHEANVLQHNLQAAQLGYAVAVENGDDGAVAAASQALAEADAAIPKGDAA